MEIFISSIILLYKYRFLAKLKIIILSSNPEILSVPTLPASPPSNFLSSLSVFYILGRNDNLFSPLILTITKYNIIDRRTMEKVYPSKCMNYKQTQIFGYKGPGERVLEEDIISSVKYDQSG